MSNQQYFEGDLKLFETPDGGEVAIENGFFVADHGFSTAVYISLFGGNIVDSGKVKNNKTWWGNTLSGIQGNEKVVSRFQNTIMTIPLTVKNIKYAEEAAKQDLDWMVKSGIIDEIVATGNTEGRNRLKLFIKLNKAGKSFFESSYGTMWGDVLSGV
jgi:phage gp46-like protein